MEEHEVEGDIQEGTGPISSLKHCSSEPSILPDLCVALSSAQLTCRPQEAGIGMTAGRCLFLWARVTVHLRQRLKL